MPPASASSWTTISARRKAIGRSKPFPAGATELTSPAPRAFAPPLLRIEQQRTVDLDAVALGHGRIAGGAAAGARAVTPATPPAENTECGGLLDSRRLQRVAHRRTLRQLHRHRVRAGARRAHHLNPDAGHIARPRAA